MNILISACLLGVYCRYDGNIKKYATVLPLLQQPNIHLIPICPEQAGGLATPRKPAERQKNLVVTYILNLQKKRLSRWMAMKRLQR